MKFSFRFSMTSICFVAVLLAGCRTQLESVPTETPLLTPTAVVVSPINTPVPATKDMPLSTSTATLSPIPTLAPVFTAGRCPFKLPSGMQDGRDVDCGTLVVPENRADPSSRTIRIAVAIFRYPDGKPEPDPIIYLEGGPGGSALEYINLSFENRYRPVFAANRDIVVFDQRGVGFSTPTLDCPEYTQLGFDLLDNELNGKVLSKQEMYDLNEKVLEACAKKLRSEADLTQYNSKTNAADVNDLRIALGYDKVNLWGISYGTRLALEVMRDYPQGLRSVVIDSVVPPDVNIFDETPLNAKRAFDTLFDGCAANSACNQAYPNLRSVFFDTVDSMNQAPASFNVLDPLAGKTYPAIVDGDSLVSLVFQFLYDTDIITLLPQIIYETHAGDYDKIASLIGLLIATSDASSDGMNLSVNCNEEYTFSSLSDYEANVTKVPELRGWFEFSSVRQNFTLCPFWKAGRASDNENLPVSSDIPTLVMSGQYDPITPPSYGEHAAASLSHSYFFTYPGVGHGASTVKGCPQDMFLAFIEQPSAAPDDACIAKMKGPQFILPAAQVKVELEAFKSNPMGIQGIKPTGWKETSTGVFSRNSTPLDTAVVLIQAGQLSASAMLDAFTQQLGLKETPQPVNTRRANNLTWTLYSFEVQGVKIDLALAESGSLGLVALLQSDPKEQDTLYTDVFLPVVDALKPLR